MRLSCATVRGKGRIIVSIFNITLSNPALGIDYGQSELNFTSLMTFVLDLVLLPTVFQTLRIAKEGPSFTST
jgi:hypothetical protein